MSAVGVGPEEAVLFCLPHLLFGCSRKRIPFSSNEMSHFRALIRFTQIRVSVVIHGLTLSTWTSSIQGRHMALSN